MNYGNSRDMYKFIPFEKRTEMAQKIQAMDASLEKDVLTYTFIQGMSSHTLARYAKENNILIGKRKVPICSRRIEQIMSEYFPEWRSYSPKAKPTRSTPDYKDTIIKFKSKRDKCCRCGSTKNIEIDHVIPLAVGGTTDDINLQPLCRECHAMKTAYERTIFPVQYRTYKNKRGETSEGQLSLIGVVE